MSQDNKKVHIATIDCTPTWQAVLPVMIQALEGKKQEGRDAAAAELLNMAKIADEYVAMAQAKFHIFYNGDTHWAKDEEQLLDVLVELNSYLTREEYKQGLDDMNGEELMEYYNSDWRGDHQCIYIEGNQFPSICINQITKNI